MARSSTHRLAATGVALLVAAGCTVPDGGSGPTASDSAPAPVTSSPSSFASTAGTPSTTSLPQPSTSTARPRADPFDSATALDGIRALAAIGPRDAASPAYARAADWVVGQLRAAGYRVTRQAFELPAGVSWGVRVPAGRPVNVVADPPGFDPARPHLVIGAHLDTVPQSPGAEDNASGITTMIELARMVREEPVALPVRFVAFGAEEARGGNGTRYAFGSRHFVGSLGAAERRAVRGMVALDRVGVRSTTVPVCTGGRGTGSLAAAIRSASRAAGVATNGCTNRASDHVSFEAAGIPAVRIGSVPYAAYHSARDVPSVVDPRQLERVGATVWAWLRSLR
ncbi:M28 family metallopeptidase [Humibacillus xanthopallidus]|uniref:Peptidase M28-like protein n=1 Tax=Humibacillus xanthopallidus TaxID=412689 RepID=A0A543HWM5_9MICO|nr:M28 family peptidase [Humibacillus xanthopallidus]TQM62692.1 peptidase M28-like protein [Humibacillus xanthopallidus]